MAEGVTYFSTDEADTQYLNLFVISATSTLESGNYDTAPALYSHLGEAWHEAEQGLAAMSAAEGAHDPVDSSLEEDLRDAVQDTLKLLWDTLYESTSKITDVSPAPVALRMPAFNPSYSATLFEARPIEALNHACGSPLSLVLHIAVPYPALPTLSPCSRRLAPSDR